MRLLLLLSLLLMGQSCEPTPPSGYCLGAQPPSAVDIMFEKMGGAYSTIIGGTPSVDRRSTVWVRIEGKGACTGVVLDPHTIITAAHCKGTDGYAIYLDANDQSRPYRSVAHMIHPDYLTWLSNGDMAGRQADIMLVYFDEELPPPYIGNKVYASSMAASCDQLTAQGWGKNEDNTRDLRESDYLVHSEGERALETGQAYPGGICFGDSGGPLYAMVDGEPWLSGITSTTNSLDCMKGSTHIKVDHYREWVAENMGWP